MNAKHESINTTTKATCAQGKSAANAMPSQLELGSWSRSFPVVLWSISWKLRARNGNSPQQINTNIGQACQPCRSRKRKCVSHFGTTFLQPLINHRMARFLARRAWDMNMNATTQMRVIEDLHIIHWSRIKEPTQASRKSMQNSHSQLPTRSPLKQLRRIDSLQSLIHTGQDTWYLVLQLHFLDFLELNWTRPVPHVYIHLLGIWVFDQNHLPNTLILLPTSHSRTWNPLQRHTLPSSTLCMIS